jgi:hypothetical protein
MNHSNLIEQVIALWKKEKVNMNRGATEAAISHVEPELAFRFPDTFKDLYKVFDGFTDWDFGGCMVSMWPLEKILEENQHSENKDVVYFADFLINSHYYGFRKSDAAVIKDYGPAYGIEQLGESFAVFISLVLAEDGSVY